MILPLDLLFTDGHMSDNRDHIESFLQQLIDSI